MANMDDSMIAEWMSRDRWRSAIRTRISVTLAVILAFGITQCTTAPAPTKPESTEAAIPDLLGSTPTLRATATAPELDLARPTRVPATTNPELANRYDLFLEAFRVADIRIEMRSAQRVTILAPTDLAFESLPAGLLDKWMDDSTSLRQILLNHVIRGKFDLDDFVSLESVETLLGVVFVVNVHEGTTDLDGIELLELISDRPTHTIIGINEVMVPREFATP
jgi:uncharacterized surface protein with fasciclin (FAS1) repeats